MRDRVYDAMSKELDPYYIATVDELREKLKHCPDEQKQIKMVLRSVVNPILLKDGGSCEFAGIKVDGEKRGL